jgi:hypothetical protein
MLSQVMFFHKSIYHFHVVGYMKPYISSFGGTGRTVNLGNKVANHTMHALRHNNKFLLIAISHRIKN